MVSSSSQPSSRCLEGSGRGSTSASTYNLRRQRTKVRRRSASYRNEVAREEAEGSALLGQGRPRTRSYKRRRQEPEPTAEGDVLLTSPVASKEHDRYDDDNKTDRAEDTPPRSPSSPISCSSLEPSDTHHEPMDHLRKASSISPALSVKLDMVKVNRTKFLSSLDDVECQTDTSSVCDFDESSLHTSDSGIRDEPGEGLRAPPVRSIEFNHLKLAYMQEQESLSETSWLTGTLIDLVFYKFAMVYPGVVFLPVELSALLLPSAIRNMNLSKHFPVADILGRPLDYSSDKPIVFAVNFGNRHWNLIRVQHTPSRELQLFEPMGRPTARHNRGHMSLRYIPQCVIEWLDTCWPLAEGSWLRKSVSAITKRHQLTTYDCGVACLLYAEKCGQGQDRDYINEWTDQVDITSMREQLQTHINTCILETESV